MTARGSVQKKSCHVEGVVGAAWTRGRAHPYNGGRADLKKEDQWPGGLTMSLPDQSVMAVFEFYG
jgi:hypothetical protein